MGHSKQQLTREEYKHDPDTQDIVERRFVKMTEAAIDIGEELVKHERGQPPRSNPESMRALGESDILSPATAGQMAQGPAFGTSLRTRTDEFSITTWFTTHCKTSNGTERSSSRYANTLIRSVRSTLTSKRSLWSRQPSLSGDQPDFGT
ncbi:DUF86 domain-containing protein [Haloferax gibbonsii]|uniref:DUF86 domain-containing protein n=1 Tax=Haloferax gibbonsii TaxID=35746 RepID=UPI001FD05FFA|nr:HepT-like ribonuclease domain-containing protein [Haloferax gibbonsii]